jgi:hypothetical protein
MTRDQLHQAAESAQRAIDDRAEERLRECNAAFFYTQYVAAVEGKCNEEAS